LALQSAYGTQLTLEMRTLVTCSEGAVVRLAVDVPPAFDLALPLLVPLACGGLELGGLAPPADVPPAFAAVADRGAQASAHADSASAAVARATPNGAHRVRLWVRVLAKTKKSSLAKNHPPTGAGNGSAQTGGFRR